jgi:Tfp pilus assembly protein PilF
VAILAAGFVFYILYQSVTQKVISIAPISVPKELANNGYTPDVAAERLQDALNDIIDRAHSVRRGPNVAGQADLPSIVVPSTSFSTETIAAQIRRFLRITSRSNVSGEITTLDKKLWLRLRLNGHDLYATSAGGNLKRPDDLFEPAAQKIFEETDPYIFANSLFNTEPDRCLKIARRIIDWHVEDPLAAWAHSYVVGALLDKAGFIDHSLAWAHTLVGAILRDKHHKTEDAIREFRLAVELDPKEAVHHDNLGSALEDQHQHDQAIAEHRRAIALAPRWATPHFTLAIASRVLGKTDEAAAEYKKAIDLDPRDAAAHNNLGYALVNQGKFDEAIAEYKKAIDFDSRMAVAHRNLSLALRQLGKNKVADVELKKAQDLEQKH